MVTGAERAAGIHLQRPIRAEMRDKAMRRIDLAKACRLACRGSPICRDSLMRRDKSQACRSFDMANITSVT